MTKSWMVKLTDEQMDCVIQSLTYLRDRHSQTIRVTSDAFDRFAHEQSRARIDSALAVFTEVGHRGPGEAGEDCASGPEIATTG